jgi:spore coat protein CotH
MKITLTTAFLLIINVLRTFSQELYAPGQITLIEITFPQNNWDQLLDDLYAAGNGERLMGAVEINGVRFDSVGVRYRGGGTYDAANAKNPLNIKLDHLKNQDFEGIEVLKLSNGAKDPSWLREVMTLEIARKYMVAPRANYAGVYVNGSFLGLYANVESINTRFFESNFLSNADNPRFECSPSYDFNDLITNPPFGCTVGHGAALEFLGNNTSCYFEHYDLQSTTGWEALRDLTSVLKNTPQNAWQTLDLDRFLWFSALNSLLANLDSYTGAGVRNYFIGKQDNGLWAPVPDDVNESFARFPWATIPQPGDPQPALSFYTQLDPFLGANNDQKPLLKAIFSNATWKRMYTAHLRTMMAENFTNGWLEQRAAQLQDLIADEVLSDGNHFYTHDDFLKNLDDKVVDTYNGEDAYGLLPFLEGRIAYLQGLPEFQATPPSISNISTNPSMPAPGASVVIKATVSNASTNTVWLGHRNNLKEAFTRSLMSDDGAHGDGAAGDGVYGASVTVGVGGIQYYIYAENGAAGKFSPERAEFEFHSLGAAGSVVINELMASNKTTAADQNGEFDDWVELFNNTATAVNLSGWFLTDDPQDLMKWTFPNGTFINGNDYLVVWSDDDEDQAGLHTSFNLSSNGEELILVMPNGTVADRVLFGGQLPDISFARCPNGVGAFDYEAPTFDKDNTPACLVEVVNIVDNQVFSIYPNPADDWLFIETSLTTLLNGRLLTAWGRAVRQFSFSGKTSVSLSDLPAGLYFLEIEGKIRRKIVAAR